MTNNLKAERTLTAELIAAAKNVYDKLASETATVTIFDQERLGDALRSQSLSTQQPMGEAYQELLKRQTETDPDIAKATLENRSRLYWEPAALHPNQESGE